MFQDANQQLFEQLSEFADGEIRAAIDITKVEFKGNRAGREKQILGYKDGIYAYQYATINIIGEEFPSFVLGMLPVKKGYSRKTVVENLLEIAEEYVDIDLLLMDREFGGQKVAHAVDQRGISFLILRRITGATMRQDIEHMKETGKDTWIVERSLPLEDEDGSYQGKIAYVPSEKSDDPLAKTAFITNIEDLSKYNVMTITSQYSDRWCIENDYKKIKQFMASTRSKSFTLRFFYFMFACLLHNTWRVVDVHARIQMSNSGEQIYGDPDTPLLTARDFLEILEREFIEYESFLADLSQEMFFGVDDAVT